MFKKLFKAVSKRFTNDKMDGTTKELTNDADIRNAVNLYNTVSDDLYIKNHFLNNCQFIIHEFMNEFSAEEPNEEIELELTNQLDRYYTIGKKEIGEMSNLIVPLYVKDLFHEMLDYYNKSTELLDRVIQVGKWTRSNDMKKYELQKDLLFKQLIKNEITNGEYEEAISKLYYPKSPLKDGEGLPHLIIAISDSHMKLNQIGARLLEELKRGL
ncbi:hypothetical protein J6TS2_51420 [Heyndrickxia sporothermodurans]|nr:hypothetical protein J6TS2_51420 [Heyndrickxia sporothermodurans]